MLTFTKDFFALLTNGQRQSYIGLQLLFLVTAIIQVAGIASIAPFIALISNPDMIHENATLNHIYNLVGAQSVEQFFFFFAFAIMATIVISNSIAAFSTWRLFKFSVRVGASLRERIYTNYIGNDYVFFGKQNSSKLIAKINHEVPRFVYMVMQPLLNLSSQLFVATLILGGLFYIDYILATLCFVLVGGIYFSIFKTLRGRLAGHGDTLTQNNKAVLKLFNESLGGIKEVKLLGSEGWYKEQVKGRIQKSLKSEAFIALSGDLPRFVVESATLVAILGLALYLLTKYGGSSEVISILSLYAMAGYKLLPAMQVIYKSFSQIKANGGIIAELLEEIERSQPAPDPVPESQADVQLQNLPIVLENISFTYPEANRAALQQVNLTIAPNTLTSFVGASGAGKSTAVDIILGLLFSNSGTLRIGDYALTKSNCRTWQKHLGYVPQNIFLIDDTIRANIAFGIPADTIDNQRVLEAAKLANIHDYINSLPDGYDYVAGERGAQLSGGQKQRIGIARALYHNPDILILDEATSALDTVTEGQIMKEVKKLAKKKSVIMIAHRLSTVKNSDKIVFFNDGCVGGEGTFEELLENNEDFAELVKSGLEEPPKYVAAPVREEA